MTKFDLLCTGLLLAQGCLAQDVTRVDFTLNEITLQQQQLQKAMGGAAAQDSGAFGPAAAVKRLAVQKDAIEKFAKANRSEQVELRSLLTDLRSDQRAPGMLARLTSLTDNIFGSDWTTRYFPSSPSAPERTPGPLQFAYLNKILDRIHKVARVDPNAPGSQPNLARILSGQDGGAPMGLYQFPEQLPEGDPLRLIARSVVALTDTHPVPVGHLNGSGFCMSGGRIISAAHVLFGSDWSNGARMLKNAYVAVAVPSDVPGDRSPVYRMFEIDPRSIGPVSKRDLVEFRVRPSKDANGQLRTIQQVCGDGLEQDSDFSLKPYERISVLGFGERSPLPMIAKDGIAMPSPSKVAIEEKRNCPIPYLAHGLEGMSGGPLIRSTSRKVLGVVVWQPNRDSQLDAEPANEDSSRCAESLGNLEPPPVFTPKPFIALKTADTRKRQRGSP